MPERLKKLVSCFLIMGFLALTISFFAGSACAAGTAEQGKHAHAISKLASVDKHTPCCPCDEDGSTQDHCNSFCSCVCHAHLPVAAIQFFSNLIVTPLEFHESFQAIAEVYLSKFVPPHILA